MSHLSQAPWIAHLGWALIHFLWQGALVGLLYAGLCRRLRQAAPHTRYCLAMVTLCALALLPLITFLYLSGSQTAAWSWMPSAPTVFTAASRRVMHAALSRMPAGRATPFTAWVVSLWLGGVALMGARALVGWRLAAGLRRPSPLPAAHPWQPLLDALAANMQLKHTVQLLASARAQAPLVVGWLKPAILIPPSAVCGLSWRQAEMILAHELAHIRRHDAVFNLLQILVETLLFYHPVIHWISRDARRQREFCCDDAVMETCGDRVGYLKALAELADSRLHTAFKLAANGGSLLQRAYRLANHSEPVQRLPGWTALLLGLSAAIAATGLMHVHALDRLNRHAPVTLAHRTQPPPLSARTPLRPASEARLAVLSPTRVVPAAATVRAWPEPVRVAAAILPAVAPALPPLTGSELHAAPAHPPPPQLNIVAAQPLPQPAYPYLAWHDTLNGAVQTTFRISDSGRVEDIDTEMLRGPVALAGAVRAAVSAWRFEPVQFGHKTIAPRVSLIFTFKADSGNQPAGGCMALTGSHLCHWYQVAIQSFRVTDAGAALVGATTLSSHGYTASGNVAIQLASDSRQARVFCQPGSSGCPPLPESAQHRQQIEQVLDQLGTGSISGY